jgi:hypothetical protein
MAHIGQHPAPGFGELIPGSFVIPSNPIVPAGYIPHIGELLPASFPIPQNPLIAAISSPPGYGMPNTSAGLGCGCSSGCGSGMCGSGGGVGMSGFGSGLGSGLGSDCGCIGGMCGCGMSGLGQFDPMTLGLVLGGLVLAYMLMAPGGKGYRQEVASAKSAYTARIAKARSTHRGYKRVARGTTQRLAAGAAQL